MCYLCALARMSAASGDEGELAAYTLGGRRWTDAGALSGGTTTSLGTNGGVVAWSLVGAGLQNATGDSGFFSGTSVALSSFLAFDYTATLRAAFDAWSSVANIEFIQVADGGGDLGLGTFPTIRVAAGYVDGSGSVLASAWYPASAARSGDIAFDSGELTFWTPTSFFLTAVHEIGHTIGLGHSTVNPAIMSAYINLGISGLQSDDVVGARAIYGDQDFGPNVYYMPSSRADLTLIDGAPNLTIVGNGLANAITGSPAGEVISGAGGADTLRGGGGDDTLDGGTGADLLYGDAGADTFLFATPSSGSDRIFDFESADRIALKGSAFGLPPGSLSAAGVALVLGTVTTSAAPTLLYDAGTSRLSWDADGNGAGAPVELAQVSWTAGMTGRVGSVSGGQIFEAAGDFDRNGTADVLWRDGGSGSVGAWLMGPGGVLSWAAMGTVGADWVVEAAGDFDGNGATDVLWRNAATTAVGAWLMGDGRPGDWLAVPNVAGNWQTAGVGDFDRNGIDDVLWINAATRAAGAWLMSRGAPGGWMSLGTINAGWEVAGLGDFDADGTEDVLFLNTVTRATGAWQIRDGQPVGWWAFPALDASVNIAAVADVNADGVDDVVLRDPATGTNAYWRVSGGAVGGLETLPSFDASWSLGGAGAFDGSVGDDLLWRSATDGSVVVNSLGLTSAQFIIV
jgi:hypothetical protein